MACVILAASAFACSSAKYTATYTNNILMESIAVHTDETTDQITMDVDDTVTMTLIKAHQDKELSAGLSAEIGLTTGSSVKGKNSDSAKTIADAAARVVIIAVPVESGHSIQTEPGPVVLSKRAQKLNETLDGILEYLNGDRVIDEVADSTIECVVTDEEIGMFPDTIVCLTNHTG